MNGLTHLSLFSGIGGLDLAAEWAGFKTVGQCEWADYPTKVLEKHWPDVPRWRDIRTLTGESFYERTGLRTVDVISGGFPCQPFSVAGKRRGKEDDRFLWPEMGRVIKELRPTWIVGENVAGIVKMALPDILSELGACGYRTRTFLIPACAVGARHRRYRVAIVAYAENQSKGRLPVGESKEKPGFISSSKDVQHTNCPRCEEQYSSGKPDQQRFSCRRCTEGAFCHSAGKGLPDRTSQQMERPELEQESKRSDRNVSDTDRSTPLRREPCKGTSGQNASSRQYIGNGKEKYAEWQRRTAQSGLGGMADGVPDWMDGYWDIEPDIPRIATDIQNRINRLKCLGNAVVPQQFYQVFKTIAEIEQGC